MTTLVLNNLQLEELRAAATERQLHYGWVELLSQDFGATVNLIEGGSRVQFLVRFPNDKSALMFRLKY